jgi:predicted NUDIX family phosphoesterase
MTQMIKPQQHAPLMEHDELILVIKRDELFPEGAWTGMRSVDLDGYTNLIQKKQEFMPRSHMETDPTYKQIIPYLIYQYEDRYFLMQRQSKATEQRLQSKYSLGIGGHIRKEDLSTNSIADWAHREFHEEVSFNGTFTIQPLGILNDDSNAVGQVHAGFVFLLKGDSPNIKVKSELKSGVLLSLDELQDFYDRMESWSQTVFTYLKEKNK